MCVILYTTKAKEINNNEEHDYDADGGRADGGWC